MPIPSLYLTRQAPRNWNIARAAAYGGGIGALAACFKIIGPLHGSAPAFGSAWQILGATLAFAVLCAGAAALRNLVTRRLIWNE